METITRKWSDDYKQASSEGGREGGRTERNMKKL
jgi:hypothetical protein